MPEILERIFAHPEKPTCLDKEALKAIGPKVRQVLIEYWGRRCGLIGLNTVIPLDDIDRFIWG